VALVGLAAAAERQVPVFHSVGYAGRAGPPYDGEAIVAAEAHGIEFLTKEVARLTASREGP
jgi:hypothetical protein